MTTASIAPGVSGTPIGSADGKAPAPRSPSGAALLFAALCGVTVVAAIKLAHLWMASMPIIDLRL